MNIPVLIFFSGNDPLDREFAAKIADSVKNYSEPRFLDVDKFRDQDVKAEDRPTRFKGVGVYILSFSMLDKPYNRENLIKSYPAIGLPGCFPFYICRGITPSELIERYPELEYIFDNANIGSEQDLESLNNELKECVVNFKSPISQITWKFLVKSFTSQIVLYIGLVMPTLYFISFAAPFVLLYFLLSPNVIENSWRLLFTCLAMYGMGYGIWRIPALDLWSLLGRGWKLPEYDFPKGFNCHTNESQLFRWIEKKCLENSVPSNEDSICSKFELDQVILSWLGTVRRTRRYQFFRIVFMSIPAILVVIKFSGVYIILSILGLFIGILFPSVCYWASMWITKHAYSRTGLTDRELDYTDNFFVFGKFGLRNQFPLQLDKYRMLDWALGQSIFGGYKLRRCLPQADRIFVSYTWEDEKEAPNAKELGKTLDKLKVGYFLDTRNIYSKAVIDTNVFCRPSEDTRNINFKFAGWRWQASVGILESTHVFVVIGPKILKGRTVLKEIRMSLQRWHTELYPAIICVVEPEIAAKLLKDENLPIELRFLLRWCPRLNYEEARNPNLIKTLLQQRRRQGFFQDWKSVLFPESSLRDMLSKISNGLTAKEVVSANKIENEVVANINFSSQAANSASTGLRGQRHDFHESVV